MVRAQNNSQGDHCFPCPGSSDQGYALLPARWTDNESRTGPSFFCKPCPKPATSASCAGKTNVTSLPGWWIVEEEILQEDTANAWLTRPVVEVSREFRTYQCEPGVCMGSNKCDKGRTGTLCGGCPKNHILEVSTCKKCPHYPQDARLIWKAIFCVVSAPSHVYFICIEWRKY